MSGGLEETRQQEQNSSGSIGREPSGSRLQEGHQRPLPDRLLRLERIIGSLAPKQWRSIASRVPPGHREERDTLARIARLSEELREDESERAPAEKPATGV